MTSFDHSAIWGEHPGVYIVVYEHDVHLKITNYELHKSTHAHTHTHTHTDAQAQTLGNQYLPLSYIFLTTHEPYLNPLPTPTLNPTTTTTGT